MSVEKFVEDTDIQYSEIQNKAEIAESIAEEKGINLDEGVIAPHFDMNGPIVDKQSIDYSLHANVREAMELLDERSEIKLSMLSGWDVSTLEFVAEDILGLEMDHVGELGSQAIIGGEETSTVDAEYDEIVDFRREVLLAAAADEITINEQGNISPVTGCTYGEGHRKGLFENHPIAQQSEEKFSVESLYNSILDEGVSEEDIAIGDEDVVTGLPDRLKQDTGEYLSINLGNDEAVEALTNELTHEYPLMGLKPEYVGGQEIRLTANTDDTTDMSDENFLNYFQRLMESISSGTNFTLEHNPDLSTDFQRSDIDVSKADGANYRIDQITEGEAVLTNIGDKGGDVIEQENSIPFVQTGYPAENYVQENGIESVPVRDAAEYSLIIAELIERHR